MIKRTFDYRIIKHLVSWKPVISSEVYYLLDDENDLWVFHEYLDGLMIHAEMSINTRGKKAIESAKRAFEWIFKNTNSKKIYAGIPVDRKKACYMARWSGMEFTHIENNKRFYEISEVHHAW